MATPQLSRPRAISSPALAPSIGTQPLEIGARHFDLVLGLVERLADGATAALAIFSAYGTYRLLGLGKMLLYRQDEIAIIAVALGFLFVLLMEREGVYRPGNSLLRIRETERVLRVCLESLLLFIPVSFFGGRLVSRWVVVFSLTYLLVLELLQKQIFFEALRRLHARGIGVRSVLIYGAGHVGRRLFSTLSRSHKLGLTPVSIVDDDLRRAGELVYANSYTRDASLPITAGPLTRKLIRRSKAQVVLVAIPSLDDQRLKAISKEVSDAGAQMVFLPNRVFSAETWVEFTDIDGMMLAYCGGPPRRLFYAAGKRLMDSIGAAVLCILTFPLWVMLAIAIQLDSPGPVFFTQKRVGLGNKIFRMFKFRSMKVDAPAYECSPTETEDPRITRVGKFLRRTSLDELPQLINVLRGEMSLVGPRPEMPFIVKNYSEFHRQRLSVKPGMTGLWQLSADRAFLIHENIEYDLYYIRHRSLLMDVAILFHTVLFAARGI